MALLLWLFGALSGGHDASADLSPRLAAIEKQLNDLAARPAPARVDPKAVDDLAARLAKLESAQAAPRAPVTDPVVLGRINAAESATEVARRQRRRAVPPRRSQPTRRCATPTAGSKN